MTKGSSKIPQIEFCFAGSENRSEEGYYLKIMPKVWSILTIKECNNTDCNDCAATKVVQFKSYTAAFTNGWQIQATQLSTQWGLNKMAPIL